MRDEFEPVEAVSGGKRLAVDWAPWMGDWFVSSSPRNGNTNAEGEWGQWVDMAVKILQHAATKTVRPEAHAAVADLKPFDFYTGTNRELSTEEVESLFGGSNA
jgi:hypothetical protein